MGNQQERLTWLAGFIDGEGNFQVKNRPQRARNHKYGGNGIQIEVRVNLANTSETALEVVEQIMKEQGLAYYIQWRPAGKDRRTRPCWLLTISGIKRLQRFLPIIIPYLVVKRPQAEAMLAFCESRVSRYEGQPNLTLYSEDDLQLRDTMKMLNQNPQRLHAEPVYWATWGDGTPHGIEIYSDATEPA